MTLEYKAPNRISGLETDTETATTFEDFFTSDNWVDSDDTKLGVNTSLERIDWSNPDSSQQEVTVNDRTSVSDTAWVLRGKLKITTLTTNTDPTPQFFTFSMSDSDETEGATTAQDSISIIAKSDSSTTEFTINEGDGGDIITAPLVIFTLKPTLGETYYLELIRLSATRAKGSIYNDQSYTELLETHTVEITSTVQTLRYIKVTTHENDATPDGLFDGYLTNVQFWNSVTSVDSKPTDVPNFTVFDETDTAVRQTYYGNKNYIPINTRFDSYYQHRSPFTILQKQHFWEFFSGKQLSSIWTQETGVGSPTYAMDDSVDGGFSITTGTSNGDHGMITFNNKRQYNFDGSVIIGVIKIDTTSNGVCRIGLTDNTLSFAGADDWINIGIHATQSSDFFIRTSDGSSQTTTSLGTVLNTNWNTFKAELTPSNALGVFNGVLGGTHTTNLPAIKLQPQFNALTDTTATRKASARYLEAYNT